MVNTCKPLWRHCVIKNNTFVLIKNQKKINKIKKNSFVGEEVICLFPLEKKICSSADS